MRARSQRYWQDRLKEAPVATLDAAEVPATCRFRNCRFESPAAAGRLARIADRADVLASAVFSAVFCVALGAVDDRFDYSYAEGVTLRVFEVDAVTTSAIVIPDPAAETGARFALTRAEDSVLFEPVAGVGDWRVQFVGRQDASSVREGVAEPDPMGLIVRPTEGRVRWALG